MSTNINVFSSKSTSAFLLEVIEEFKKKNSRLSIRGFATKIGLSTHTILFDIKSGRRKVPLSILKKVCSYLKLTSDEKRYLDFLYQIENPIPGTDINNLEKSIQLIRKKNALKFSSIKDENLNNSPLYCFILEALDLRSLPNDLKILTQFFKNKFSHVEIQSTIDYMIKLGLLSLSNENFIVKNKFENFFTEYSEANKSVQNYHKRISKLAHEAITEDSILERSFNGICLNVDQSKITEMNKCLREFMDDFISKYCDSHSVYATTYQLSFQFFKAVDNSVLKEIKNE